ncbi:MAG TPA: hypothetical protein VGF34_13800, partial [Stellaceae bacterium]
MQQRIGRAFGRARKADNGARVGLLVEPAGHFHQQPALADLRLTDDRGQPGVAGALQHMVEIGGAAEQPVGPVFE